MATFSWLWDSVYEGIPSNKLNRALIDDHMRNMCKGVRERMEPEHNWGPYVGKDDGSHRGGYVTACDKGDAAARAAYSDMQTGALFLLTDGSDLKLCVYISGTGWVEISSIDHGILSNLDQDTHTQYLLKAGGSMSGNLEMGGENILMATIVEAQGGFVQKKHEDSEHNGLGNIDAFKDNTVGREKIAWHSESHYFELINFFVVNGFIMSGAYWVNPPDNAFVLCPNFSSQAGLCVMNAKGQTGQWQIQVPTSQGVGSWWTRFNFRYFLRT